STRRNQPPIADFDHSTDELTANFTDASYDPDGFVISWSWSFGDGATSGERNPTHTYPTPGTYEVTLTVTDNAGAADSESKNVTVTLPAPTPTPSYTPPSMAPHPMPRNPDFTVSISPQSQSVTRGQSTNYTVTVTSLDGYEGMISLSLSGLPKNSTGSLGPSSVHLTSGCSATSRLSVTTTDSTPTGTHMLTVTGRGSRTRSATASLTVQQPVTPTLPQVIAVSAGSSPPSLKAYDRGSRYDPLVINYYDMTAAGWDASKAAANVWARAEVSYNRPDTTPQRSTTSRIISLSGTSTPQRSSVNIALAGVSIARTIISRLFPLRLF
ncbi:MAG: PKD domain-containing protein, partial [Hadesarchaea archaeon]|nr:PKD domain-containing protein [Hadesarchaea archaeon]